MVVNVAIALGVCFFYHLFHFFLIAPYSQVLHHFYQILLADRSSPLDVKYFEVLQKMVVFWVIARERLNAVQELIEVDVSSIPEIAQHIF